MYKTKHSESLMRYFKSSQGRFISSCEVKDDFSGEMGEATVYRLLNRLTEEGYLERRNGENGSLYRLFEDRCDCLFHLHCTRCGRVDHLDCDEVKSAERHILSAHGFSPSRKKTVIEGLCRDCVRGDTL